VKVLRFLVGLFLVPLCLASTQMLFALVQAIQPLSPRLVPLSAWALLGGFTLWILLYFTMPRPVLSYILAHELTHALWGLMMGASVSGMRVSKDGGCVRVSKTNFLITLAPYFFPLYTFLVVLAYYIAAIFLPLEPYYLYWLALVGFTWGFHLTFTVSTLFEHQTDIQSCGYLFSYTVIYLLNVLGIALWTVMVSPVTLEQMMTTLWQSIQQLAGQMVWVAQWVQEKAQTMQ
jgi:hypothetical protein